MFKTGDIVQVKSGGPEMTVASSREGTVYCFWFNYDQTKCIGSFPETVLVATKLLPPAGAGSSRQTSLRG